MRVQIDQRFSSTPSRRWQDCKKEQAHAMPLSASSELCVGMYAELRTNELLAVRHSTGQTAQMFLPRGAAEGVWTLVGAFAAGRLAEVGFGCTGCAGCCEGRLTVAAGVLTLSSAKHQRHTCMSGQKRRL